MNRNELEHILRAAGSITKCQDIVVIGSQAILGSFPDAPAALLVSREADVYPLNDPEKAELIDGSIGERSPFDDAFGYYGHGVGPETAILPPGWQDRLVRIETPNTAGTVGWCLSPHDLAVSKLLAGRDKDMDFVRTMLSAGLVSETTLSELAHSLAREQETLLLARLARLKSS